METGSEFVGLSSYDDKDLIPSDEIVINDLWKKKQNEVEVIEAQKAYEKLREISLKGLEVNGV